MGRLALFLVSSVAISGALLASGCSCEGEEPVYDWDAGYDAGAVDAGEDAGWEPETPGEDAAVEVRDAGDCVGRCCALDEEVALLASDHEETSPVAQLAVDSSANLFASISKGPGDCLDRLLVFELDSRDFEPETFSLQDECHSIGSSPIGAGDGGWLLLWVDRRDSFEVRSAVYVSGEELVPAEPFQVSENDRVEQELAMVPMGESMLVAWVEKDVYAGTQALVARQISLAGEPLAQARVVRESNELSFNALDLASLDENRAMLLYKADGDVSELVVQLLDETGQPQGPPEVLSSDAGLYGSAAAAFGDNEGAIVYSLAPSGAGGQVRFRSVTGAGLGQKDLELVSDPELGSGASIAKVLTGFMVAYRATVSGSAGPRGMIRVMFLDPYGNVQASSDVYEASISGGRTTLGVSSDLRAAISWTDFYEDSTREIKMVNLWCLQ